MEQRRTVNEKLTFAITKSKEYKIEFCTWGELINTDGLLTGDVIHDFKWEERKSSMWGMDPEDQERTYYIPSITVIRPRPENDKEFEDRMREKARTEKIKEEKERLEYLRLKAKYEDE